MTLTVELTDNVFPRPELMPADGKETLMLLFERKIPFYEAKKRLRWTDEKLDRYLSAFFSFSEITIDDMLVEGVN